MSWSNELILEFLELYKKERLLWDIKHPRHKNRNDVTSAWMRIQSAMSALSLDCTIIDLKRKKESLMTAFRFHVSRKKLNPHYDTSWFAYKSMESFLGGRYNLNDSVDPLDDEFFDNSDYNTQSQAMSDPTPVSVHSHNIMSEKNNTSFVEPKSKRFKLTNNYRDQTEDVTTTISSREVMNNDSHGLDEYELYGKLLAKKLRKLDEHQRDVAMHEIDNIMFRAKMDSTTQSRTYTTPSSPVPPKMKSPIFIVTQSNNSQYENENISYQESGA